MSDMGKVVVKRIGELDVVCRELTVGQLRGMAQAVIDGDLVDAYLFADLRLSDLPQMCNLSRDQIDGMRPSDLRVVVEACKEANPDFFAMLARATEAIRTSLASSTSASAH